jgi:ABC-type cobalamin transport system ATPase subunit
MLRVINTPIGKSTTLRAIAGMLPLKSGTRQTGDGLNMGIFTQDLAQGTLYISHNTLLLYHYTTLLLYNTIITIRLVVLSMHACTNTPLSLSE